MQKLRRWDIRRRHSWHIRCNPQKGAIGSRGIIPYGAPSCRKLHPIGSWIILKNINNFFFYKAIQTPTVSNLIFNWPRSQYIKYKLWNKAFRSLLVVGRYRSFKISYLGKSFKWHRRRKGLHLKFGRSHISHVAIPKQILWKRKLNKMRILMCAASKDILAWYSSLIINWRPNNVYHGRGLRVRYTSLLRKAGKVSTFR